MKRLKHIVVMFAILLVAVLLPTEAKADYTSGDWTYTLKGGDATIVGYNGTDCVITIPSTIDGNPVVSIGSNAFQSNTQITSVTMPSGITSIESSAFSYCDKLESIVFSNDIATIGNSAFSCCSSLTEAVLPDKLEKIGNYAFYNCYSLKNIVFPKSLTSVGYRAYYDCRAIESIVVHAENAKFDSDGNTFYNAGKTSGGVKVEFSEGVKVVPSSIFESGEDYCARITEVKLPSTVEEIDKYAFYNCAELKTVRISERSILKKIGNYAFYNCKLLSAFMLPQKLENVGYKAFYGTEALSEIVVNSVLLNDFDSSGDTFYNAGKESGGLKVIFSEGVSRVPNSMFRSDSANAARVTDVIVSSTVENIGNYAFSDCTELKTITLHENSKLKNIGQYAFEKCKSLTKIVLPEELENVGYRAFYGTEALSEIVVDAVLLNDFDSSGNTFYNTGKETENGTAVIFSNSVTRIPAHMFRNNSSNYTDYLRVNSVIVGNSVEEIGKYAFYNCVDLKTVEFGEISAVKTIGDFAFSNCKQIERIVLPDTVTNVAYCAFSDCSSLSDLTLNNTVCEIYLNKETMGDPSTTVLHGLYDSTLQAYAEKYGYRFEGGCSHNKVIDKAVAATCEKEGLTEGSHCSLCNEVFLQQEVIPAEGHKEQVVAGKAATCTESGLTDGSECSVCGKVLKEQETVPATGHKDADKDQRCDHCGLVLVCQHINTSVVESKPATCGESGLTEGLKCSDCGEILKQQEVIPATGEHKDANHDGKCDECGASMKCSHKNVTILAAKKATCSEKGLTEGRECSVCGEILQKQETIPALGHDWDGGEIIGSDKYLDTLIVFTCDRCGINRTEAYNKVHRHFFGGYPDGSFAPQNNITRAEVAVVFYAMMNDRWKVDEGSYKYTGTFTDVSKTDWFALQVEVMASLGLTSGYPDGTFKPYAPISRAEFATMAIAMAQLEIDGFESFPDVDRTDWFYDYVRTAAYNGLISGYPNGDFRPRANITRAEATVVASRMMGRTEIEAKEFFDYYMDDGVIPIDVELNSNREVVAVKDWARIKVMPDMIGHWAYYWLLIATNDHYHEIGLDK